MSSEVEAGNLSMRRALPGWGSSADLVWNATHRRFRRTGSYPLGDLSGACLRAGLIEPQAPRREG